MAGRRGSRRLTIFLPALMRTQAGDETFAFCAPAKMRDDPRWVDVTSLYTRGLEPPIAALSAHPGTRPRIAAYAARLAWLRQVLDRDLHEEKITGEDKSIDVVVDIFNLVNSGGTKLSKGDPALAKKCAQWPEARAAMHTYLERQKEGFSLTLDWLLRDISAVATGRAEFGSLDMIRVTDFRKALETSAGYVGHFLDVAAGHLGLDHDRVLMGRYSFPVICRLPHLAGGHFADVAETGRVLYWYIHSALWGRYAGSTETVLNQDFGNGPSLSAHPSGQPITWKLFVQWKQNTQYACEVSTGCRVSTLLPPAAPRPRDMGMRGGPGPRGRR